MEKRKVGRPRKTSTPVVKEKKYSNWKEKYEFVAKELEIAKAAILEINRTSNEVVE